MKIIDSHMHLGDCRVFGCNVTEKDIEDAIKKYNLSAFLLQPYPGASNEEEIHKRIYEMSLVHPGEIFGLASVNPHIDRKIYEDKMAKYITEYGFKGLKIHTIGHAVHPQSQDAQTVAEVATELNVPVNVHTGPGVPFSLPSLLLPLVKKYYNTKFVLAHSGASLYFGEALILAQEFENVYLEMSWCSVEDVANAISSIGSNRVMFGSDSLMNIKSGMDVFNALELDEKTKEDVFYKTAANVFKLEVKDYE